MKNPLLFHRIPKKILMQFIIAACFIFSVNSLFSQEVTVNKYAVENATNCNQFDITLEVIGNPPAQPQEVVLVIDRSGSMDDDDGDPTTPLPIEYAQDAAIDFINQFFLPVNNPTGLNRISIVTFGTTASLDQPLTDSSGQATLITTINNISTGGRTNTEQAVIFADNELTNNGTFDCKTNRSIILLSDGVPTSRDNGADCASLSTVTPCQTEAIQAAQDSWTTTVAGEVYNQSFFTIGLIGAIDGAVEAIGVSTLDQMQNAGAFTTEDNADLTGIYNTILGQLVAAATQLPSQALVTDIIQTGYTVVPGSIVASKGTGSVSGQTLSWDVDNVFNETITLNYTIEGTPTVCGVNPSGTSTINYEDSSCNTASITFNNPTVCLPCPQISPTISQSGCTAIDYSSTLDQGGCSSMADSYAWEFFLDGNSVGTSNTLSGTFNYTGAAPFEGNFTATLTYTGTYGTGCILPNVSENSNTVVLPNALTGNISSQTNVICPGASTGQIVAEGIDGTAPYSYSIDGGSNYQPSGTFPGLSTGSYTITILDDLGCTTTVSTTITDLGDSEDPTISCPADVTANTSDDAVGNCSTTATLGTPTTADNCSVASVVAQVNGTDIDPVTFEFGIGDTTVTWIVTDGSGNTASCTQTVTVSDDENPEITCPSNINVNVDTGTDGAVVNYTAPVGTDNCPSPTTTQTAGLPSGSLFPVGTTTNTFEVTDASGNTATCSFDVTVTDNEDPTINCPATINVNVDGGADGAVVTYTPPVGTDNNASGTVTTTQIAGLPSGSLFPVGTTTNTFEVTDASGNTATCSFDVTVTDNEDPTITCPAPIDVNVDAGADGAVVTYTPPVGTDNNASGTVTTTQIAGLPSGSLFPVGTTTNTFEVTDASGNTATCSFDVTVTDNEDPTINCPAPIDVNVDADTDGAIVTYTAPVGTDNNASGTVTTTQIAGLPSGSLFPVGTTTNTFEVTDASGNTATCSFDVTVTDNEDPTINCPAPIDVNVDAGECGAIVTYTTPVGTDNSTGAVTTQIAGLPSGSLFPVGTTTNTFEVTDASGNTAECSFDVTITDDENPTITCPADVTANTSDDATGNCSTTVSLGTPTTDDNCSVASVVAQVNGADIDPVTFEFGLGDTTVTWIVTDGGGNTANCTQTVTVVDDENPTITCPADVTANTSDDATGNCSTTVSLGTPTTGDNCSVASVVAQVNGADIDPVTFEFPLGDTTVTWIVTDGSGNTANCTQTVTVVDDENPTITCPADVTANTSDDATGNCATTVSLGTPTTGDNCSVASVVAQVNSTDIDPVTFEFPLGDTTVTWIVTDGSGNTANCTQTVTVNDDENPTITCPADVTANTSDDATGNCSTTVSLGTPTTDDNCSVASVVAQVNGADIDPVTFEFPLGDTTVTWIVTDGSGNTANCTQTVTVVDDEAPTITCPVDITVNADAGLCSASNVDLDQPVTDDNCGVATVLNNALEPFALGQTTVTWTVTDNAGNTTTCEQIVTVVDGELPELICPPALTVNVDPGTCEATNVSLGDLDVEDCTDVIITNNAPSTFPLGDTTVIWTATDLAGNSETCEQLVTVVDNIPPTFVETLPADITVECDNVPTEETLTATDNCSDAVVTFEEVRIDGSCVSNYILERTWTATDESGLTTVHTQTITVEDTTPPAFVERLPEDITVECDAIPTPETITATDNCSTATVTTEDVIIEGACEGTYTIERTYTATDECNLTVSYTQTINVQDTTAPTPVETLEENITVSCTDIPEVPEIQFQDNCSSDVTVVFNEVNGFDDTVFEDYQIVRTWTVRDACNNEEIYTQTLNVMLDEIITQVNGPDRCFDEGIIDLNDFLTSENKEGTWELLEGDPAAELNGNLFNPTTLEPSLDFLPNNGDSIDYLFRYTGLDAGCINITEVVIRINPDCVVLPCGSSDVVISKALTPNGDGFNDSFDIMGIDLCGFTANVKIFNRWGALIYESSNYTLGEGQGSWQGDAHKSSIGSAGRVPNGTYYYIINLENSGLAPFTGPIYIGTK